MNTLAALRQAWRSGERSAVDICREALAAIDGRDSLLGAFNTVTAARALERAALLDRERSQWTDKPLAGVPVAVKDNLCTRGVRTTASSRVLETFVPPYDATAVAKLELAGAIIVGKTNCDEFAMGSSNENSAFRPARNPWATDRIPGGSSGGSAVAVAGGMVPLALGSDTGGSIRQPAALCGIVGLKPTYGRVSRFGLLAFASSLDQIGPLTWTVEDAAIALSVIAGADACDATSAPLAVPDYTASLTGEIEGLRVGVPAALVQSGSESGIDAEVAKAFVAALDQLKARGATIVDIELPSAGAAIPTYYLVATAEASSNLARYDGVRYGVRAAAAGREDLRSMYRRTREMGFGAEVKRRIMLGTYVLSAGYYDAYYLKAQQVRTLIRRDYDRAFEQVHLVAMPTSPTAAFRLGERVNDPVQMYLADVFTVSANLAGLPAISVPCGFTAEGLPIGLQLTAPHFDEATLLRTADAYERDVKWAERRPSISTPAVTADRA
jgi:aspartyl-tRNA(Asn)/glutamyl-tRNA(Gln) amidotransferase subunit A